MIDVATLAEATAEQGFNWEMWIVISNMALVFVTLMCVVATVIDNKIMVKAIVRIVSVLAPSRKQVKSCGKHCKAHSEGNSATD